jgi:hypothetical protein
MRSLFRKRPPAPPPAQTPPPLHPLLAECQTQQRARRAADSASAGPVLSNRAVQAVRPDFVFATPAFRCVANGWPLQAEEICANWLGEILQQSPDKIDVVQYARMIALLEEERMWRRKSSRPAHGAKLFPELNSRKEYEQEAFNAFLMAVRQNPADDELRASIRAGGTGHLHLHRMETANATVGALGVGVVAATHPTGIAATAATRGAVQLSTGWFASGIGKKRLHYKSNEDTIPHGVAKPTRAMETAPGVMPAALAMFGLRDKIIGGGGVKAAASELHEALAAASAIDDTDSAQHRATALHRLREALATAEPMLRIEAEYKLTCHNALAEWKGNRESIGARRAGQLASIAAGIVGGTVTGPVAPIGATVAAVGVNATAQLAFQLSGGPGRDMEQKVLNVAINGAKGIKAGTTNDAGAAVKSTTTLRQIAERYREYHAVDEDPDSGEVQKRENTTAFRDWLHSVLRSDVIHASWQRPLGLRMDAARRLLRGKLARRIHEFQRLGSGRDKRDARTECRAQIRQLIVDIANLDLAGAHLADAASEPDAACHDGAARPAARVLEQVHDRDVRQLFNGTLEEQNIQLEQARLETAGELFRHRATYAAAALPSVATGVTLAGAVAVVAAGNAAGDTLPATSPALRSTQILNVNSLSTGAQVAGDRNTLLKRLQNSLRQVVKDNDAEGVTATALPGPMLGEVSDLGYYLDGDLDEAMIARVLGMPHLPASLPIEANSNVDLSLTEAFYDSFTSGDDAESRQAKKDLEKLRRSVYATSAWTSLASGIVRARLDLIMRSTRNERTQLREDAREARALLSANDLPPIGNDPVTAPSTVRSRRLGRGFGVASWSRTAPLPFQRNIKKTPDAVAIRRAVPDAPGPSDNPAGLRRLTATSMKGLPGAVATTLLERPADYQTLIGDAKLFPGQVSAAAQDEFETELALAEDVLSGPDLTLLVRALSSACADNNARPAMQYAARALACLRGINLIADVLDAHPDNPAPAGFNADDQALAWRCAQMLGGSPQGMAILHALTKHDDRERHPTVAAQDDLTLSLFLQAGRALVDETNRANPGKRPLSAVPVELFRTAGKQRADLTEGNNTVLVNALPVLQDHLRHNQAIDEKQRFVPIAPDPARADWTITMLRNGMTSDAPDSDFAAVEKRLQKHVKRTTTRRSGVNSLKDKEPFNAFNLTTDTLRNLHHGPAGEVKQLKRATHAMQTMLAFNINAGQLGPLLENRDSQDEALRTAIRSLLLQCWQASPGLSLLERRAIHGEQLDDIRDSLHAAVRHDFHDKPLQLQQHLLARIDALLARENQPVSVELLFTWMEQHIASRFLPPPPEDEANALIERFGMALDAAVGNREPGRIDTSDRAALAQSLKTMVQQDFHPGASLTATDGGAIGAGTKGLSQIPVAIASGGLLGMYLDLRARRRRQAEVTIKNPSTGPELLVYSSTGTAGKAGGGLFAGIRARLAGIAGTKVGVGADLGIGADRETAAGAVLRLGRYDGASEEVLTGRFAQVLERFYLKEDSDASLLKDLMTEFPDLSVGRAESAATTAHVLGTVEGAAGLTLGDWTVGPAVSLNGDLATGATRYTEQQGIRRIERSTDSIYQASTAISGRLFGGNATNFASGTGLTVMPPTAELGGASANVWKKGHSFARELSFDEHGLLEDASNAVDTFANLKDYIQFINDNIDLLCESLARKFDPDSFTDAAPMERLHGLQKAHKKISEFSHRARQHVAPTQTFVISSSLKPEVRAAVNQHLVLVKALQDNGDAAGAQRLRDQCEAVLKQRSSWYPDDLLITETTSETSSRRIRLGLFAESASGLVITNRNDQI